MCQNISDHDDPRFSCDCHLLGDEDDEQNAEDERVEAEERRAEEKAERE